MCTAEGGEFLLNLGLYGPGGRKGATLPAKGGTEGACETHVTSMPRALAGGKETMAPAGYVPRTAEGGDSAEGGEFLLNLGLYGPGGRRGATLPAKGGTEGACETHVTSMPRALAGGKETMAPAGYVLETAEREEFLLNLGHF
jgi:hypothetical protein